MDIQFVVIKRAQIKTYMNILWNYYIQKMSNHRTLLLFMIFLSLFVNETISNNEEKKRELGSDPWYKVERLSQSKSRETMRKAMTCEFWKSHQILWSNYYPISILMCMLLNKYNKKKTNKKNKMIAWFQS